MLRKGILGCLFTAGLMVTGALAADIRVNIAPPRVHVEHHRPPSPGAGYVWTPGYHRWDGNTYVWNDGSWVRPPRTHARWVAPRWRREGHEWVFVEGHWR
jgi:hypothetical protein